MQHNDEVFTKEFNPTFLFSWKGVRIKDEALYHVHDYLELAFIVSGRGRYKIDDVMYDIEEGDLLILNPGTYHQSFSDPSFPATEFFIGVSDFELEGMRPNCLDLKVHPIIKTDSELKQNLKRICLSMEAEKDGRHVGRYFMMRSLLIEYMLYIMRAEKESNPVRLPGDHYSYDNVGKKEIVSQIIDYFSKHYSEKLSLDIISGDMYVSPFYISKSFKSVTGDTPIRYLINIRLDKAREILQEDSGANIAQVAAAVGYDDVYHFSKSFKKRFGVSPSKVKRQ